MSAIEGADEAFFARLSVFEGSFSFLACAEINADCRTRYVEEQLTRLKAVSAIQGGPPDRCRNGQRKDMSRVRYWLTAEKKSEAAAKLGGGPEIRNRHAHFFLRFLKRHERRLMSPDRRESLQEIEADLCNVRRAIEWCLSTEMYEEALGMAAGLFWFWSMEGRFQDGKDCLTMVLKAPHRPTFERAKALYAAGGLAFLLGDGTKAKEQLTGSMDIWLSLPAGYERNRWLAYTLVILGRTMRDFEKGRKLEEEAVRLFRQTQDAWGLALARNDLGYVLAAEGEKAKDESVGKQYLQAARKHYERSLSLWREMRDPWGLPLVLNNLGSMIVQDVSFSARSSRDALNDLHKAAEYHDEALRYHLEGQHRWGEAESLKLLADVALQSAVITSRSEDLEEAEKLYQESLIKHHKLGRKRLVCDCLLGLAKVNADRNLAETDSANIRAAQMLRFCCRFWKDQKAAFVVKEGQRRAFKQTWRKLKTKLGSRQLRVVVSEEKSIRYFLGSANE